MFSRASRLFVLGWLDDFGPLPRSYIILGRAFSVFLAGSGVVWAVRRSVIVGAILFVVGVGAFLATFQSLGLPPDVFTADFIRGSRTWRIVLRSRGTDETEPVLEGVWSSLVWESAKHEARCQQRFHEWAVLDHAGPPPDPGCTCGIYAWKTADHTDHDVPEVWASGQVLLSGQVLEAEDGYRAQYAQIERLVVHADCVAHAGVDDGQKIGYVANGKGFRAYCAAHLPPDLDGTFIDASEFMSQIVDGLSRRYEVPVVFEGSAS